MQPLDPSSNCTKEKCRFHSDEDFRRVNGMSQTLVIDSELVRIHNRKLFTKKGEL